MKTPLRAGPEKTPRHAFGALLCRGNVGKADRSGLRPPDRPTALSKPGSSELPPATGDKPERNGRAGDQERDDKPDGSGFDPLDPATRSAAQLAPPPLSAPPAEVGAPFQTGGELAPRARVSMEELLPQLVKRIAWAGDRKRGSVHLELGAGPHAGTTVTVHADAGRIRVELQGEGVEALRARIAARLERQGLDVESVT